MRNTAAENSDLQVLERFLGILPYPGDRVAQSEAAGWR